MANQIMLMIGMFVILIILIILVLVYVQVNFVQITNTGNVEFPDGTIGSPGIYFGNQPGLGFSSNGAKISISTPG